MVYYILLLASLIEKAGLSDQGDYYCVAISVAGSSSAVARLTVFGKHMNVVNMMYTVYCCRYS